MRQFLIVAVAVLAITGMAQDVPPAPKGSDVFPDWQKATDTQTARQLCKPMGGTMPVTCTEPGSVRLPANFVSNRLERVSWDIAIKADLRMTRGVQFDFYCGDLAPFSSFSLYFRSGRGWYHATFSPEKAGAWQRVVIDKANTRFEGTPAGWDEVDTLRLSGWRGSETGTVCAIANVGPVGGKPDVLVLRADSNRVRAGGEARGLASYAASVSATLDEIGVVSVQMADTDLVPQLLENVQLVVLPYNLSVPAEKMAILRAFVGRGGKLLACYSLDRGVRELLGLRVTESVVPKGGSFSGFARTAQGLDAQPAFAPQGSWRTTVVAPAANTEVRVIAVWRDAEGADTSIPAITLTPNGAFLGHVWFRASAESSAMLMRSLVGELVPDIWRKTAEKAFAEIGAIAGASDFTVWRKDLPKDAPGTARQAVAEAVALRTQAASLLKNEQWSKSVAASGRAKSAALRAWCLSRTSRPGEHRAFWCHSAFGLRTGGWDASIRFLSENGFNAILPNMLWAGLTYYPSKTLPEYRALPEKGDQIAQCLAACRKYGVACHVWKVNWNTGGKAPNAFIQQIHAEGRAQKTFTGEWKEGWLCPSHPTNQTLEVESMLEIVRNYDVDGIHFDYIRYPGRETCFCDGCRGRFEAQLGHTVKEWPQGTREPGKVSEQWLDFRRSNITTVVRRVAEEARKIRPGVEISAAVFRNWPTDRDTVGQDWKVWCDNGWLDFVCPMDYVDSNALFRNMVTAQKTYAGKVPLYPGIGLSCWNDPKDAVKLAEQIAIVRELNVPGFTVFNYDGNAQTVLPYLRLGVTSE